MARKEKQRCAMCYRLVNNLIEHEPYGKICFFCHKQSCWPQNAYDPIVYEYPNLERDDIYDMNNDNCA